MFYRRDFFQENRRAELFDYGDSVGIVMSEVTHMLHDVHGVDTTEVYVLVVKCALARLKI